MRLTRWAPMIATAISCLPAAGWAQRSWLDPAPRRTVTAVITTAAFDDGVTAQPVVVLGLGVRQAIGDGLTVGAGLVAGRASQQSGIAGQAVGNPWFGLEYRVRPALALELGAWPGLWSPTDQEAALPWVYGELLEFDRREAWLPRTSSVRVTAQVGRLPGKGPFATLRLGASGTAPRGMGIDGELYGLYAGRVGVVSGAWTVWAALLGRAIVTESGIGFGDRSSHRAELAARVEGSQLRAMVVLGRGIGEPFAGNTPVILRSGVVVAW